jgi:hypothetical protein
MTVPLSPPSENLDSFERAFNPASGRLHPARKINRFGDAPATRDGLGRVRLERLANLGPGLKRNRSSLSRSAC